MKMQALEWEKIFATHKTGKEIVCRIYKEILQLHNNKMDTLKNRQKFKYDH